MPCVELVGGSSEKPGLLDAFDQATDSLNFGHVKHTVHAVLAYRPRQFPLPGGGQLDVSPATSLMMT